MMQHTTIADRILIVVLIVASVTSFFVADLLATHGFTVLVEVRNVVVYKGNLSEDSIVSVHGALGDVTIQMKDGKVAVVKAHCPNRICMRTGWRSLAGESIICVPNHLVVRILGDSEIKVQGVTG
ncbi:MAG TPA: NusG domain II-containing protein [Bacteroidota bacterium]|nr:NusG domain II-containing protein [Bacteroidota bacterium]